MAWRCYTCDTMSGRLDVPIDIPSFSWALTVSDSSFDTQKDKGTGEMDVSGLTIPWSAIPADKPGDRESMLATLRRGLVLCHVNQAQLDAGSLGDPVVWGAIGSRTDTYADTSFSLLSPLDLRGGRYAVKEGVFGTGDGNTSKGTIAYSGLSFRAIAARIGALCTSAKPGGALPIDWQYGGESGQHERTYMAYDVSNDSASDIFTKLSNVDGGPDMQFRPYFVGQQWVRLLFVAGSDAQPYITTPSVRSFTSWAGGGNLDDLTVDYAYPTERVYGTGSGQDDATLCHLSEDLTLVQSGDPWPLVEAASSDTDADSIDVLSSHTDGALLAASSPLMQMSGSFSAEDDATIAPGRMWPGELVRLTLDGFPSLPDGVYAMRVMELSGDESEKVDVKFDVYQNPWYE